MTVHDDEIKRTPGQCTRQRILATAVELFSSQGYAGTSVSDIAGSMGMTKAALYYHFESKEQILEAVTEPLRTELDVLVRRAGEDPTPMPGALLTGLVDILSRHALLIQTVFNDPSAIRRKQHGRIRPQLRTLAGLLSGSDSSPAGLLRARCAIGAVQAGVLGAALPDAHAVRPLPAAQLLGSEEHVLDAGLRREVVDAALRALGLLGTDVRGPESASDRGEPR